jgi:glucose/arabinose dehydrogenase
VGRPWWTALGAVVVLSACAVLLVGASAVAAPSAASPRLVTAIRGLAAPVFVTQAPGEPNRFYVVEQAGMIRVVEKGRIRGAPFLDIRSRVVAGGEQGLLGLAFPKNYAKSRTFYVNYTAQGSGATVIDR